MTQVHYKGELSAMTTCLCYVYGKSKYLKKIMYTGPFSKSENCSYCWLIIVISDGSRISRGANRLIGQNLAKTMSPTLLLLELVWLTPEQETSCPGGDNSFVVLIRALSHWLVIH